MTSFSRISLVVASAFSLRPAVSSSCQDESCTSAPALSMVQREASLMQTVQPWDRPSDLDWNYTDNFSLGHHACPCVGIGFSDGRVNVRGVDFAAGLGSTCQAWEQDEHPSCSNVSSPPDWCSFSWCYVDPCNCGGEDNAIASYYFPQAQYQGKALRYSYATCGSPSSFVPQHVKPEPADDEVKPLCGDATTAGDCNGLSWCAWKNGACVAKATTSDECAAPVDEEHFGDDKCRCIGIDNMIGTMKGIVMKYWKEQFPAEIGGSCQAWDSPWNPGCFSDANQPHWCMLKFCYVDPCTCDLAVPARKSSYFPNATYQGKPLYYSYQTCGNDYQWSMDGNYSIYGHECVQQATTEECAVLGDQCAWINERCREKELDGHC